jgi:threonine dehydrogenase-like Zn-dependent dehydrogenase
MTTQSTKAITYHPSDGGIRITDVPVPPLEADEALVRILRVSLTRRDHLTLRSSSVILPEGSDYIIPGHIAVGKVVETGDLVRDLTPGDLVVPTIRRDCDRCIDARSDMCAHPDRYRDSGLSGADGFARELAVVKARYLVPIPAELEDIALLLTPLSVAEKAHTETVQVTRRFNFYCYHDAEESSPRALVTGMGPIGMMMAFLLSLYDYRLAIFCRRESDDKRSDIFRDMELEYINTSRAPMERLLKAGYSFRQIFETTGDPAYMIRTMPFMAPNAVMVMMGAPEQAGEEDTLNIPAGKIFSKMIMGNQVLLGSIKAGRDAFDSAVKHLQELDYLHGERLRNVLSHTYPFEEYHKLLTLETRDAILPSLDLGNG